jgi:hypothetical protein
MKEGEVRVVFVSLVVNEERERHKKKEKEFDRKIFIIIQCVDVDVSWS